MPESLNNTIQKHDNYSKNERNYDTVLKNKLVRMNIILLYKEKRCLDARTNLSDRFEDWFYIECKIESQQVTLAEILQADELQGKHKIFF